MVLMIRPDGGVCRVHESRVDEYLRAGFRPVSLQKGVSRSDTPKGRTSMKPLRKRKGLEITQ